MCSVVWRSWCALIVEVVVAERVAFDVYCDPSAYEGAAWTELTQRLTALLDAMRACPGGEVCDCPEVES